MCCKSRRVGWKSFANYANSKTDVLPTCERTYLSRFNSFIECNETVHSNKYTTEFRCFSVFLDDGQIMRTGENFQLSACTSLIYRYKWVAMITSNVPVQYRRDSALVSVLFHGLISAMFIFFGAKSPQFYTMLTEASMWDKKPPKLSMYQNLFLVVYSVSFAQRSGQSTLVLHIAGLLQNHEFWVFCTMLVGAIAGGITNVRLEVANILKLLEGVYWSK